MSTITALVGTDGITTANSMTKINTNFANLNSDKIETSTLDTDTSLAANSDSKIATQKAVKAYIDTSGGQNASETVRGIVEEATDAEVTAGTATGATGAKLFITPAKLLTYFSTVVTPISNAVAKLIGVGQSSNTTYENYQLLYGSANTVWGWTNVGTPDYYFTHLGVSSAEGITSNLPINLATGSAYLYTNTKIKIIEWDASITADAATATSAMGFCANNTSAPDWDSFTRNLIAFGTRANGTWACVTANGTNSEKNTITTPSAGKHTFRIEYNSSSEVKFYIDGTLVATNTTFINTSTDVVGLQFVNGTTSTIITGLSAINIAIQK